MKKILTAVLMSASLASVCGHTLYVNAMESIPDVFTREANDILSKGFCDEVKETGNKLLTPRNYFHDNFNDVMYKLVGLEMNYYDSVRYRMREEMIAETTDVIMNRCRNILPYGSIIGNWKCAQDNGNGASIGGTISYGTDGKFLQQGTATFTNSEDGMVASIGFKIDGEYVIKLGRYEYYQGLIMRNGELRDISPEPSDFSRKVLSSLEGTLNEDMIDQLDKDSFTLFQANRYEQRDVKCDRIIEAAAGQ
tara:strand:- start:485 stop:1237 length:753 start_codon:yes stop_codon:yes gene_type:complete